VTARKKFAVAEPTSPNQPRDAAAEGKAYVRNPTVTLPPGTVALEPPRPKPRTKYDWPAARQMLEDNPGLWVMVFTRFSTGMFSYVRRGGPEAFHGLGGQLQVSLRNQEYEGASKFGNLWLRWIPEGWTDDDQKRVEEAHAAGEGVL
jgi:hypothetical protein